MPIPSINIRLSGTSVSGDIDTTTVGIKIQLSNSDQIGYAAFALANPNGTYTNLLRSGNPTVEIDINNTTKFRGYCERVDKAISVEHGTISILHCYDKGEELLNIISPDARQPPPTYPTGILISGDQGINAVDGIDLVLDVSGLAPLSGATVASFMAQYFGTQTDPSGSFSGTRLSFKPHISGYTWDTWYKPDLSGSVDNNINYFIPLDTLKVRREFGWDTLRKLTRGNVAIDLVGNRVSFESYIGVSGDIHIFTSGSSEFLASGNTGQKKLIYYASTASGSALNNVTQLVIPEDTTTVKNRIMGWFPTWTHLPIDGDSFTDLDAFSGARWSGQSATSGPVTLSGNVPANSLKGFISIMGTQRSGAGTNNTGFDLIFTPPGPVNIVKFIHPNTTVNVEYDARYATSFNISGVVAMTDTIQIYDASGNSIWMSGEPVASDHPRNHKILSGQWIHIKHTIFSGITFASGNGNASGWGQSGAFNLSGITLIKLGCIIGDVLFTIEDREMTVDNLYFSFNHNFSPVVAFNSGSQGLYRRRYDAFEYQYSVTDVQASGIMSHVLDSKMGSKAVGEAIVKDNKELGYSAQLDINPGQLIEVDAPALGTGSGQTFDYWKVIGVDHDYSVARGFITHMKFVPWFSGTLTAPYSNQIDYTLPFFTILTHSIQTPKLQSNTMWVGGVKSVLIPMNPTDNVA